MVGCDTLLDNPKKTPYISLNQGIIWSKYTDLYGSFDDAFIA
jgi:hypothetical protein